MSNEWDGARGCLLQAIDDLENMYGASDAATPEQCLGYVADARAQARRIAEMVGDWA